VKKTNAVNRGNRWEHEVLQEKQTEYHEEKEKRRGRGQAKLEN